MRSRVTAWVGELRGPRSLRREARRGLGISTFSSSGVGRLLRPRSALPPAVASLAAIAVPAVVLFLPVSVCFGPFDDIDESRAFLSLLWQVVATALGLSVAIIAVLFSALLAGTAKTIGISLIDFAKGSGMLAAVRLGVAALVVDGLVLLPVGHDAPGGWAAFVAVGLSGVALLSVLWVFERSVVSIDPQRLVELRLRKLRRAAEAVVHLQVVNLAAEQFLERRGSDQGIGRALTGEADDEIVVAGREAVLWDVRLGRLRRVVATASAEGMELRCRLTGLDVLGRRVRADEAVMVVAAGTRRSTRRRVRRALRFRRSGPATENVLRDELEGLHRQALAAIREGDRQVWDLIATAYMEVMLALPRAAARYGLAFDGAVATGPGFFARGPVENVQRFLYTEIEAAVQAGDRSFALDVAHLPVKIATSAAPLNAPALIRGMLDLYPALYLLAQEAPQ